MAPTGPSSQPAPRDGGRLATLSEDECWTLLAQQTVSRIAWTGPEGPVVVPVNHGITDRTLWIRTTAYAALAREADDSRVAVECDRFDDAGHTGWSVLVKGTAHLWYTGDDGTPPPVEPWPAGPRPLWVLVRPREVTGRRLVVPAPG
ncbi:pyridoxamine 5'-phosphate oxidase family protein [Nocardioides dongkuii]|uniref:pyridoxamine 5'-phosphate oxidase family protein n=1 Tax=Nocardioides dongkuii TaxID=2760089 RepID=UPI0015FAC733|nr:pyridoxamine 5'-phosphate oxidase family protein [Nocardioides dongkuii]